MRDRGVVSMEAVSAFFMRNIVYVYFFYGLAFFALGLVVLLESGRASEFRFRARAGPAGAVRLRARRARVVRDVPDLRRARDAVYGRDGREDLIRIVSLVLSFLLLLDFGTRLLPGAEDHPARQLWQVAAMGAMWLAAVGFIAWRNIPPLPSCLSAADVLARYSLAIPGALLAAWALLRERRDFHARGMSAYGQDLLWAALAFFIYGVAQFFTRPSLVFPSQTINTAFFLRTFGIPVQLLRGLAAVAIAITLGSALRAFERRAACGWRAPTRRASRRRPPRWRPSSAAPARSRRSTSNWRQPRASSRPWSRCRASSPRRWIAGAC